MSFAPRSMKRRNVKGLAINAEPPQTPSSGSSRAPNAQPHHNYAELDAQEALEIGVEFRLDLHAEDLVVLKELGSGNGGSVSKVQHTASQAIMARKIIHVEAKKEIRKRIVRELGIMHECSSPYIVSFYGAFMNSSNDVVMCMEYMDVGSLDAISKHFGPVRIDILGKIAEAVLGGLTYLYSAHRIMHRDIKPSNILLNSKGMIKLCDFGVSSELENSVADTFVGTGTYMAPERIQGSAYTVKSDVWSVGLTLMELAVGRFPFASDEAEDEDDENYGGPQGILDLLQQIVMEPSPRLPESDAFPQILNDMLEKCLLKDPQQRPTPKELFDKDDFVQAAKRTPVDLVEWAIDLMERHNRKSHLPLAASDPYSQTHQQYVDMTSSAETSISGTPTSLDIPIQNLTLATNARSGSSHGKNNNGNTLPSPPTSRQPSSQPPTRNQPHHMHPQNTLPPPQPSSSYSPAPLPAPAPQMTALRPAFPARVSSASQTPPAHHPPAQGPSRSSRPDTAPRSNSYNHPPIRGPPPTGPLPLPPTDSPPAPPAPMRRPPALPPNDPRAPHFDGY